MPNQLAWAACPAPFANITTHITDSTVTAAKITEFDIAPPEYWRDDFAAWLDREDAVASIINTVDLEWITGESWADYIANAIIDAVRLMEYPPSALDITLLDTEPDPLKPLTRATFTVGDLADLGAFGTIAAAAVKHIALEYADQAFNRDSGAYFIHKGELVTAGENWGGDATPIFDAVTFMSQIDYFTNFRVVDIEISQ